MIYNNLSLGKTLEYLHFTCKPSCGGCVILMYRKFPQVKSDYFGAKNTKTAVLLYFKSEYMAWIMPIYLLLVTTYVKHKEFLYI